MNMKMEARTFEQFIAEPVNPLANHAIGSNRGSIFPYV